MKATSTRPCIQAVLSDPEAHLALVPILKAIGTSRADLCAVSLKPARFGGIPAGIGPLLSAFGPPGRSPRVVLVHADPAHPLTAWAASHAARERSRGARILAVQRGVFHCPPPGSPDERAPWDAIAVWGPAFGEALPEGTFALPLGSPSLERLLEKIEGPSTAHPDDRLRELARWRSQARAQVRRELGLLAGRRPILVAFRLKGHWWPQDRLMGLAEMAIEAVFEAGHVPVLRPDPLDGSQGPRFAREVAERCERAPHVLSPGQWKTLDRKVWLAGMAAIVAQGGEDGVLGAALGTPSISVLPPDSPIWVDPLVVRGLYQVVKDPFSFVRSGVLQALEETVGRGVDPAQFRAKAFMDEGKAAQRLAQALFSDLIRTPRKAAV